MLKVIYSVVVGLLIVLFVGVGIDAFYPTPDYPEYPKALQTAENTRAVRDEPAQAEEEKLQTLRAEYDETIKADQQKREIYSRNVSIVALLSAILVLGASLLLMNKLAVIADGLMMGGLFTTFYSIVRGFEAGDSRFRFLVITIGLAVAIGLGYIKFVKPMEAKPKEV